MNEGTITTAAPPPTAAPAAEAKPPVAAPALTRALAPRRDTLADIIGAEPGAERLGDLQVAEVFARSRLFTGMTEAAAAMVKVMAGRELGIGPFAAMGGLYIVPGEGRPSFMGQLLATLVKRSPVYDYRIEEHTDSACAIAFYRREGGKLAEKLGVSRFDWNDAKRAGLDGKPTWKSYPRNMLFWRALANGVRFFCPDVTGGPFVLREELDDGGSSRASESEPRATPHSEPELEEELAGARAEIEGLKARLAKQADVEQDERAVLVLVGEQPVAGVAGQATRVEAPRVVTGEVLPPSSKPRPPLGRAAAPSPATVSAAPTAPAPLLASTSPAAPPATAPAGNGSTSPAASTARRALSARRPKPAELPAAPATAPLAAPEESASEDEVARLDKLVTEKLGAGHYLIDRVLEVPPDEVVDDAVVKALYNVAHARLDGDQGKVAAAYAAVGVDVAARGEVVKEIVGDDGQKQEVKIVTGPRVTGIQLRRLVAALPQ